MNFALRLILLSAMAIGLGYASAFLPGDTPAWGAWLLALGTATILIAAIVLGAARSGRTALGVLVAPFLFTYIVVAGCFALALMLTDADAAAPVLWLGLPRRAAIVMYGIGLLPMLVLPVAYALTFERMTLTPEDWQRVRDAARAVQTARDAAPPVPAATSAADDSAR